MCSVLGVEDDPAPCSLDDAERVVAHVAEADADRRVLAAAEVVLLLHVDDNVLVAKAPAIGAASGPKRSRSSLSMPSGNSNAAAGRCLANTYGLSGIHDRMLGRLSEEVIRMMQQILIDRIVAGQQHGQALVVPAAAAAGLLPAAGDRARIVHQQRHIERADVDAQLERVRCGDPSQLAAEQILLDLPPLVGQVAAAIGAHRFSERRVLGRQLLAGVSMDQLGGLARARERQRLAARFDRFHQPHHGIVVRAAAGKRVVSERRRIPKREVLPAARRTVVVDHFHIAADEPRRQLARVGDRRAGGQKNRPRAVMFAHPHQPAEHGRNMGAQDAAISVHLVHHHELQIRKERGPFRMIGQDRCVQHVRIRKDEVRFAANTAALRVGVSPSYTPGRIARANCGSSATSSSSPLS